MIHWQNYNRRLCASRDRVSSASTRGNRGRNPLPQTTAQGSSALSRSGRAFTIGEGSATPSARLTLRQRTCLRAQGWAQHKAVDRVDRPHRVHSPLVSTTHENGPMMVVGSNGRFTQCGRTTRWQSQKRSRSSHPSTNSTPYGRLESTCPPPLSRGSDKTGAVHIVSARGSHRLWTSLLAICGCCLADSIAKCSSSASASSSHLHGSSQHSCLCRTNQGCRRRALRQASLISSRLYSAMLARWRRDSILRRSGGGILTEL